MRLATMDSTAMDAFIFIKGLKLAEATHDTAGYKHTYIQGSDSIKIVVKEVKTVAAKTYARITFIATDNVELKAVMNELKSIGAKKISEVNKTRSAGVIERVYKFKQWNIQLSTYTTRRGTATFVRVNGRLPQSPSTII
jgi:hypothetical protein